MIRPVVRFARGIGGLFPQPEGQLYFIEPVADDQPINRHPKPLRLAKRLTLLAQVNATFPVGPAGYLQPTWPEILRQVPPRMAKRISAIEVVTVGLLVQTDGEIYRTKLRLYFQAQKK